MGNAPLSPAPQGGTTQTITCTLDPLRAEGRDSLAVDSKDAIRNAKLSRLDVIWENATHEITTEVADDVFRDPGLPGKLDSPVPKGADPVHATFTYTLKAAADPHWVAMTPPHKVQYQHPEDADAVAPFFTRHHFLTLQKLASVLVIALALLSAAVPDLDDDDDDDDAPDDPHHTHLHLN